MSATKTVQVSAQPSAATYLDPVEIEVTGLDPDETYDVRISEPTGHQTTHRSVHPLEDGSYPVTVVVDQRGEFTVEVFPASQSVASTTFRGV